MKYVTLIFSLLFLISANTFCQSASINETYIKEIRTRSELWNTAYNNRDSISFYTLFDSLALVSSAGGRWIGAEECKKICRSLYVVRPDIRWVNEIATIEVNEQWRVGYETGNWTESWTETGDTSRSQIKGKYWLMWRYKNEKWVVISGIFTPLSCTGSYCTKKK